MSWVIRGTYNTQTCSPGEVAWVSFWVENIGDTLLYLYDLELRFDFGSYHLNISAGAIAPKENRFHGNIRFLIPSDVVGSKAFTIQYHMYRYSGGDWVDLGYWDGGQYFINIYPKPFYRAFVPRGLAPEDRVIGDPIVELVKEWGFETATVGVEIQVPEEQVPDAVRAAIKSSDAVVAVATPRFCDLTGVWRTLEWLHAETGIAFGEDKPLVILKDKRVSLGGLPSYLGKMNQAPIIDFDQWDIPDLRLRLPDLMPALRQWVQTKRMQKVPGEIGKAIVGGLAVVGAIFVINSFDQAPHPPTKHRRQERGR